MQKNDFRLFFAQCKKYIKLTPICKECGINQSALSRFMMSEAYDYVVSLESLQKLYDHLHEVLEKIV